MYRPNFHSAAKPESKNTNIKKDFYHKISGYIDNNFQSSEAIPRSILISRNFLFHKTCFIYDGLSPKKCPKIPDHNFIVFCFLAIYKIYYPENFLLTLTFFENKNDRAYVDNLISDLIKKFPSLLDHYAYAPFNTTECKQDNLINTSYLTSLDYLYLLFGTCTAPTNDPEIQAFLTALKLAEDILTIHLALDWYPVSDQKAQAVAAFIHTFSTTSFFNKLHTNSNVNLLLAAKDYVIKAFMSPISFTKEESENIEAEIGIKVPFDQLDSFKLGVIPQTQIIHALKLINSAEDKLKNMLETLSSAQFRK